MLEMGSAYLPLDSSWNEYIGEMWIRPESVHVHTAIKLRLYWCSFCFLPDDVEYTYEEMEQEMTGQLMILADDACSYLHHDR